MKRIYLPGTGLAGWKSRLAEPEKQWRSGYSACTLAHDWEEANGLPAEVATILSAHFAVAPELLFALPEHEVALPGGRRNSQSDLFALVGVGTETAAMTIEGKVEETFGPTLAEWAPRSTPGRAERFGFVTQLLGLPFEQAGKLRYQLFHRAASAVIEARRFRAAHAIMLVQSYSPAARWFEDFSAFAALFGIAAEPGKLGTVTLPCGLPLHLGWVRGNAAMLGRPDGRAPPP